MSFKPSKPGSKEMCLHQLDGCISDMRSWMANNMLKLNNEKTEFIIFGTCQQLAKISDISIKVGVNENTTSRGSKESRIFQWIDS